LKRSIAIYGAGALGREIYFMLIDLKYKEKEIFFLDDSLVSNSISGLSYRTEVLRNLSDLKPGIPVIIAQGDPQKRKSIAISLESTQTELARVIDRTAVIRGRVRLGDGAIISALSIISDGTNLAANVLINSSTVIGHDVSIGKHTSISSQVNIGGRCKIGENVFIGSGVKIRDGLKIGDNAVVSAGSVVLEDIKSNLIALGNPAKPIAKNLGKSPFNRPN